MLELSLTDRDLERLAGQINRHYARQRSLTAGALRHEEQLKESIAGISHDLRTPLTVIMGHLQLLERTFLSEEQLRRTDTALRKARRMNELIEAFYELSVLNSEQLQPHKESVNLSNLLIDFLTENAFLLEAGGIHPDILLPEKSVFLRTDPGMLERILQNLLTNAVRYSPGDIRISLSENPEGSIMLRMFDRFYTGDAARTQGSTGLGLAVVKLLAEKLGGEVTATLTGNWLAVTLNLYADL
ncbi:sensor histidine kinase [Eisenbergiella porci]|uniref:sensor histidine kinase n=1 Tax=Eisenbergiella porci TaxID=2652274 RepID=UPI003AB2E641